MLSFMLASVQLDSFPVARILAVRCRFGLRNMLGPELTSEPASVDAPADTIEVFCHSLDVALEDRARPGVVPAVDDLRKVDQQQAPLVIQEVVGRKVAVRPA